MFSTPLRQIPIPAILSVLPALPPLLGALAAAPEEESPCARETRILGVGNSFTRDAFVFLEPLGRQHAPHRLRLGRAIVGASSLQRHWHWTQLHEQNPDDPAGRPYVLQTPDASGTPAARQVSLKELLRSEPWDVVTLQQLSRLSIHAESYRPYAEHLADYIRKHAPQAEVVMHQTWAYRSDARFADLSPDNPEYGQAHMYRDLNAAYTAVAAELGLRLIPVGRAFQLARERRPFAADTATDRATLEPPALPADRNSLNRGWRWRLRHGEPVLERDVSHAGPQGRYLAAAVWFQFFTGRNPYAAGLRVPDLDEEVQAFLSGVADDIVAGNQRPAMETEIENRGL